MKVPTFLFALTLVISAHNLIAEENVCRYCANNVNALRPRGLELQGRYHFAPDRQVDVEHIKIDVTPDFEKRTISATTTIVARPISKPVKTLKLDAINLRIKSANCSEFTVEDIVSTREDLKIVFSESIPVGKVFSIVIEYTAQPEAGIYFRTPAMGYPETDTHIWTQGETHEARHWFPCFDYPNERSTSEVVCHVPKSMTVLSNGKKQAEREEPNNLKSVRWLQDIPHANYLICLVAGNLTHLEKRHGTIPLGFYSQPSLAEHAANSFADTELIMDFYEKEIGVPYPWAKYDQVTIQDFVAGGMENTTLTTLTSNTVFSKDTENISSSRGLDAHELAHQWFGDYVTCKDWSHLWLNEGFATYYAILYEGHKFGPDAMLYELYEDADGKILNNADDKRPVVFNEYNNSMDQFDYRVYPKGSWILHMLRCQLGPDLFRECIKEYLQQHALASVVTDDLRQIIEKKSGQPMDRFFSQWLYHGGVPQLQVSYEWEPESRIAKVSIKQTQEVNDQIVLFELPTKIRFVVNNQKIDRPITISKAGEDFYFQLDKQPTIVRFDPDYSVLAKVNFDKSDDLIFEDLKNADDLVGRLIACRQLAERRSEESVNALAAVLDSDSFHGVRNAAAWSLAKIGTPKAQEALRQSWQKQTDARVRSVVVFQMLKGFDPATSAAADEILRIERNPAVAAHALEAIGLYNSQEHHNKLVEYLDKPVFDDLYALAAINGIEKSGDFELMRPLQVALQKNSKSWLPHTTGNALRAIAKLTSTQDNKREVRDLIAVYLNSPRKQIQEAAIDALGDLRDPSAIALLAPLSESTDTDIQSRAKTARKAIQNSTAALPEEFSKLREELQKLREDTKTLQEKIDTLQSKEDAAKNASP